VPAVPVSPAAAPARAAAADEQESVRVHNLARQLGVQSRQLLRRCRENGINVKNHMSKLEADEVRRIRSWSQPGARQAPAGDDGQRQAPAAGAPDAPRAAAPSTSGEPAAPPAAQPRKHQAQTGPPAGAPRGGGPQAGEQPPRRRRRRSRSRRRGGEPAEPRSLPAGDRPAEPPRRAPEPEVVVAGPREEPVPARGSMRSLYRNRKKISTLSARGGDGEEEA
jgi:translation initiation factor IF-2